MRTIDLSAVAWRRSSYSNSDGGQCVEISEDFAAVVVPVRDSKAPHSPVLVFPAGEWSSFVAAVKSGRVGD